MKNNLREIMLKKQNELSSSYIETASSLIQAQVLSSELYKRAEKIFTYISTKKEPSTIKIIETALNDRKKIYVPKCVGKNMLAVRIKNFDNLIQSKFGILEPSCNYDEIITAQELDLIIVPCVSASLDGKRLGHGAGYYDRFLSQNADEKTICLCFEKMLCSDIPMMNHDVYMSCVVTEILDGR